MWPEIGKKDKEDRKGRTAVWVVEQRAAGGVCIIMLMLLPQSPVPTLLGVHEEVRRRGSTGQGNFSASCDRFARLLPRLALPSSSTIMSLESRRLAASDGSRVSIRREFARLPMESASSLGSGEIDPNSQSGR